MPTNLLYYPVRTALRVLSFSMAIARISGMDGACLITGSVLVQVQLLLPNWRIGVFHSAGFPALGASMKSKNCREKTAFSYCQRT